MALLTRWFLLCSLASGVIASLFFLPGLHGSFIFDDGSNIVENQSIHISTLDADSIHQVVFGMQPGGITRVLPTITLALDYWRGNGLDPAVFKATNIAIHALTAFVLACFFRVLLSLAGVKRRQSELAAIALALAWAIHPLQVSSVLYVIQRMQTMCTLFIVLALWMYLKARHAQIEDRSGRTGWLLTILFWMLAFGCKEDAVLLPAYTLALEITVLHFRAAEPRLARILRKGYLLATMAGAFVFLLVVIPYYWSWNNYPGRDFSSWERLLTQARVVSMYLWEIVLPMPSHMPFYYDWIQPSRGFLQPWTTLPAIMLLSALLAMAWMLRLRRPLFALGIFLFFAGHIITSNVMNLELAAEHRNHFPLIGMVLAIGDCLTLAVLRLKFRVQTIAAMIMALLIALGSMTVARAHVWGNPLGFAQKSVEYAPHSARAWNSLCTYYYNLGGGRTPQNPYLDKAIDTCRKGSLAAPYSLTSLTNLVVFESIRGVANKEDWDLLLARLQTANQGPENDMSLWVLINNSRNGVSIDEDNLLEAIEVVTQRRPRNSVEYAAIGYYILGQTHHPERAYPYFARSIQVASPHDQLPNEIISDLKMQGREGWATRLEILARSRPDQLSTSQNKLD